MLNVPAKRDNRSLTTKWREISQQDEAGKKNPLSRSAGKSILWEGGGDRENYKQFLQLNEILRFHTSHSLHE
jgi:hypothetical protein